MKINANGINVHYRIDGPVDGPWLMFSNSLATNLFMWDQQAVRLSRKYRVLRYDQRGHGLSDAPQGRYSFDTLIADAVALMDSLGIERTHFCGLSMGGATAMGIAQRHPERLDMVVICDTPCASSPASAQQWKERIGVAKSQGMTALADATIARWFPAETVAAKPSYLANLRQMILSTPVDGFVGCAAALADHDFRPEVSAVPLPVLFLVGEKDGATPAAMRQLQTDLPGSRFIELSGAGHISNLDRPDAFNRAVEDFLRGAAT
jgi:3-oxoadipate enol-lactonase